MIFQKQCRKSILEKLSFFLDDLHIDDVPSYSYLGSTIASSGSFIISKQKSVEKTRRSIFATKRFLDYGIVSFRLRFVSNYSIVFFYLSYLIIQKSGEPTIICIFKYGKKIQLNDSIHNFSNIILGLTNGHPMWRHEMK